VISFDGSYVNYRHLATLCDVMTQKGHLMSITRNGINRVDKGCLSKCSFEETVEILMMAAAFAETDHLRGVTEHVIFGQLAPFGTGLCDLVIDEEKVRYTNPNYDTTMTSAISSMHGQHDDCITSPLSDTSCIQLGNTSSHPGRHQQPEKNFTATPFSPTSPMSPLHNASFSSPQQDFSRHDNQFSPVQQSPMSPMSATYQPLSPASSPQTIITSPLSNPTGSFSPQATLQSYSITSPHYSPTSPIYSPTSPGQTKAIHSSYSITSPNYSPTSPYVAATNYSPTSPAYSPTSPAYSPTSPAYSPTSPFASPLPNTSRQVTSPTSPYYGKATVTSPAFSPMSPMTMQSPGAYSLTSPNYSPTSPIYPLNNMSPTVPLSNGTLYSHCFTIFILFL
jgi:DNA-directed RNA polymerase II subunit RPB1